MIAAVDRGDTADGPDVDDIWAGVGVQNGLARVRALDCEGIPAAAEEDVQVLDRVVDDAAATQAKPGDGRGRQDAGIACRISGVIHIQHVAAAGRLIADDRQRGRDAIEVAAGACQDADVEGVGVNTASDRGGQASLRAEHIDRIGSAQGVERDRIAARRRRSIKYVDGLGSSLCDFKDRNIARGNDHGGNDATDDIAPGHAGANRRPDRHTERISNAGAIDGDRIRGAVSTQLQLDIA